MTDTEAYLDSHLTNSASRGRGTPKNIQLPGEEWKDRFVAACAKGGLKQGPGIKLAIRLLEKRVAEEHVETEDEKLDRLAGDL